MYIKCGKLVKNLVVGLHVGPIGSRRMLGKILVTFIFLSVHIYDITYGC